MLLLQMEGVEGYFDHHDVPGSNEIGPILHDEEVRTLLVCVPGTHPTFLQRKHMSLSLGLHMPA